jgi:5-methyltetrahydrofolate--homocysteine methyltransferase
MLDVNAGIPLADEPTILAQAIQRVQDVTDLPLSIDSSVVAALEAGLEVYQGKPLVNSVTGEEERLESVLPLVKKYSAVVIGICNDESGISEDPEQRFAIAKKIVERAEDHGILRKDVLIDPLAMPIGAMAGAGKTFFEIVRRCRTELGVNMVCGASNISFGLPNRVALNSTFIAMAIAAGLPSAIINPLDREVRQAILAANAVMGYDANSEAWLAAHRQEGAEGGDRRTRRRRRRRRPTQ